MAKSNKLAQSAHTLVGNVCMYGTHKTGAGWIAQSPAGLYGDGAPLAEAAATAVVTLRR